MNFSDVKINEIYWYIDWNSSCLLKVQVDTIRTNHYLEKNILVRVLEKIGKGCYKQISKIKSNKVYFADELDMIELVDIKGIKEKVECFIKEQNKKFKTKNTFSNYEIIKEYLHLHRGEFSMVSLNLI